MLSQLDAMANCYAIRNAVIQQADTGGALIADAPALWSPVNVFPGCRVLVYPSLMRDPTCLLKWLKSVAGHLSHLCVLHLSGYRLPLLADLGLPVGYWSDTELFGQRFTTPTLLSQWSQQEAARCASSR